MSTPDAAVPSTDLTSLAGDPFGSMHDIRCPVTVQLGTGSLTVRQCLQLRAGSVLTLSQPVGEDLAVKVTDVLIAYGEVIILEALTSLRVTRLASSDAIGP